MDGAFGCIAAATDGDFMLRVQEPDSSKFAGPGTALPSEPTNSNAGRAISQFSVTPPVQCVIRAEHLLSQKKPLSFSARSAAGVPHAVAAPGSAWQARTLMVNSLNVSALISQTTGRA